MASRLTKGRIGILVVGMVLLVACGASKPASNASNPPPRTGQEPPQEGPIPDEWGGTSDLMLVRCGVDDQPSSVISMTDESLELPSATPKFQLTGMAAKMMIQDRAPPPIKPLVITNLKLESLLDKQNNPLPSALLSDLKQQELDLESCLKLGEKVDVGVLQSQVQFASSGDAFRVRAINTKQLTPFGHCLLSQLCRYRLSSGNGNKVEIHVTFQAKTK
jgi:hypothetical protein